MSLWRASRRVAAAALGLALLLAPPARAEPRLAVDPDSGRIELRGVALGPLRESARATAGPGGRVAFRAGGSWHHATELVRRWGSPQKPRLLLATDDPAGRRIALRAAAHRRLIWLRARVVGGPLSDVRSVGIGFDAVAGERYLGFGERSNAVDQRGREVESYVGEGPYKATDYPIIKTQVPEWGVRERPDATYFPMPWLLSTRGFGVLLANQQTSRFRLGTEAAGEWSAEADAKRLVMRVFAGRAPAQALRSMTARVGRQPRPAAPWQLGPWVQTGHQNTEPGELEWLRTLRAADAPVSAVETHMRYMPCGSDQGQTESERNRTAAFHALGLAALTYTREAICETYTGPYQQAIASNAFLRHADGTPYTFPAFVGSGQQQIGMLDFSNPDAHEIYRSILDRAYGNGYDGWMEDYGEYAPPDSVAANGLSGRRMHNLYPVLYHRAGDRYARSKRRPLVRFVRSGWTGAHRHAQVVWGGDPSTEWGFDGLESSVTQALTMGLSGISSWGSDVGGFFTITSPPLTEELLIRWIQFGAVSGVMRTKAEGIGLFQDQRPQVWEEPALPVWKRYAKLRTQLYPYLVAADRRYRRTGMPIMRHMALAYPRDAAAVARDDQFLFGDALLAAPVVEPGQTERELYLPRGRWIDLWRSVDYAAGSGALRLRAPRLLAGGRTATVPAPLEELPLLVKAGAMLPLLPPSVDTLAHYGERAPGVVRLADRRDRLRILAFPRGSSAARFDSDGLVRSREVANGWRLDLRSRRKRRLTIQASLATLRAPFRPRSVKVDGRRIRSWGYDAERRVLRIRLRAKRASILVSG